MSKSDPRRKTKHVRRIQIRKEETKEISCRAPKDQRNNTEREGSMGRRERKSSGREFPA